MVISVPLADANFCNSATVKSEGRITLVKRLTDVEEGVKN